ncbi:MAG: OmpA family protein [Flavobacteriaceae bacterium]|nr:OmpA family protein [Flavobacteriaceae bacterium]
MKKIILYFSFLLSFHLLSAQAPSDYAVELAAFDQSVPLSYFKKIKGVYETYDVNQIYRYHIAAPTKEEADVILGRVKKQGFPNARIIDFAYIREVCEAKCGYIPPKRTTLGAIPNNISNNTTSRNANNNTPTKNTTSLSATALLGKNAEKIPESLQDEVWLAFYEQYKDLGLKEEFLYQIYKIFGSSINIDKAAWFEFLEKNKHLGATNAELFDFFMKYGDLSISQADWFVYKNGDDENFKNWMQFKERNNNLGATNSELLALYNEFGNIVISQAMWFLFKEDQKKKGKDPSDFETGDWGEPTTNNYADIETIGFVLFEFGGTKLSTKTYQELDKVVNALKRNKNLSVELVGHADAIGNAANNRALSLRRAKQVQSYLLKKGVPSQQTKATGMGEDSPIAINNTTDGTDSPEGRKYNRRVDLRVTDPNGNLVQLVSLVTIPEQLRRRN